MCYIVLKAVCGVFSCQFSRYSENILGLCVLCAVSGCGLYGVLCCVGQFNTNQHYELSYKLYTDINLI
jgi:hypothetical protein